ncbi:MAG: AraC family transcriptional regulator ligand-binding domain-containing protein, partial [Actinomycetota bacterium]
MSATSHRYAVNPRWALMLRDLGLVPADVLRRAGLPRDLFQREGAWIEADEHFRLTDAIDEELGDPLLPLRLIDAMSFETFDPAIFAACCSRNLNVAAERIAQHKPLICPTRIEVDRNETVTEIRITHPEPLRPPPSLMLADLVFWVALARLATRSRIVPVSIVTTDPPAELDAYHDELGVTIRRGDHHAVTFSALDAARPFLTADEAMWSMFEPELRRRLDALDADATTGDRVEALLLELLPAGEASADTVAHDLGMSARTLQRRLQQEGTSFQAVLAATRERLARHYLTRSDLPVVEISFLLGYEDHHSFYR